MFFSFHLFKSPFVVVGLILASFGIFIAETGAQDVNAELNRLYEGINLKVQDSAFLAAPREVTRPLLKTKKLILEGDVKQAVDILGEILADEKQEDYLIPDSVRSYSSMRRRTEKILGWLGKENRASYELKYGIRARKRLEKGLAENEMSFLKEVAGRYFFTKAGVEATMVLGHLELSAGRPSAAISHFSKVLLYPDLANDYDPEVSVLLATCHLLGGNRPATNRVLESLKQRQPNATVTLMGQSRSIFAKGEDRIAWLTSLIGDSSLAENEAISQWLMSAGNPARTGKVGHGLPLFVPLWKQRLSQFDWLQNKVDNHIDSLVARGVVPAPAYQPLVVGNTVVQRTFDRTFGVDIDSGKRLWAYPPNLAWNIEAKESNGGDAKYEKSIQRGFEDAVYGQASSDGQLVFLIPFPGAQSENYYNNPFRSAATSSPRDQRQHNELVAIDCEKQGAVKWRVGGATGLDEPKLAKTFFLGEPLPFEGLLYCACFVDDVIKLVVIDSQTGSLRWQMQLAAFTERRIQKLRRLAGITPAYANGKLYMMTGTSAAVAIDISTRSLVWGYVYKLGRYKDKLIADDDSRSDAMRDAWRYAQAIVANGKILLTPRESRDLFCLDAETGLPAWYAEDGARIIVKRTKTRDMYIAGIFQNQAVLVGASRIRGIDLENGKQTFEVDFSKYGVMAGRGYLGQNSLFVPTTRNHVIRIDLLKHEITESALTGILPGNIVRVGKKVISHGANQVACFAELNATEKDVAAESTGDLTDQQIFVKAQTLIQRGQFDEGMKLVEKLSSTRPKPAYADLLLGCAEHFLQDDPKKAFESIETLNRLYPDHSTKRFDRERGFTALRAGRVADSIEWNLEQIRKRLDEPEKPEDEEADKETVMTGVLARWVDDLPVPKRDLKFESAKIVESTHDVSDDRTRMRLQLDVWPKIQIQWAWELLSEKNAVATKQYRAQIDAMFADALKSPASLDRAIKLLPTSLVSDDVLIRIARQKLSEQSFLESLMLTNEALQRQPSNSELMLLKASIYANGGDAELARDSLSQISRDGLSESNQATFDTLEELVATETKAKNNSTAWTRPSTTTWNSGVVSSSETSGRGRLDTATLNSFDHPRYQKIRVLTDPVNDNEAQLQIADVSGNVRTKVRFRKQYSGNDDWSANNWLTVQNHAGLLHTDGNFYLLDWFKIIQGETPTLWRSTESEVSSSQILVRGDRRSHYIQGNILYCRDTLTGERLWYRSLEGHATKLTGDGDRIFVWLDEISTWATFDAETGRLTDKVQSFQLYPLKMQFGKAVVKRPLRASETKLDVKQEANKPYPAWRIEILDLATGKTLWQKDTTRQAKRGYMNDLLFVLEKSGQLDVVNFRTGELLGQSQTGIDAADLAKAKALNVFRHDAGIVMHLDVDGESLSEFSRGRISYEHSGCYGSEASGPVVLLDQATFEPKWRSPARLSQMAWLDAQPFDSPFLMFSQNLKREGSDKYGHYHCLVLIDAEDGRLASLQALRYSNYSSPLASLRESDSAGKNKQILQLSNYDSQLELVLDRPQTRTPAPPVNLGARGAVPFRDRILAPATGKLKDIDSSKFKQMAIDAARKLDAEREQRATQLKEKMGVR